MYEHYNLRSYYNSYIIWYAMNRYSNIMDLVLVKLNNVRINF